MFPGVFHYAPRPVDVVSRPWYTNRTATDPRRIRMARPILALLLLIGATQTARSADPDLRSAIERGVRRVQGSATRYIENRSCFSCHHQLAIPVLATAKERGFDVDNWVLWSQTEFTRETFRPKLESVEKGRNVGGANTTGGSALFVLEASGDVTDDTTAGVEHGV